MLSAHIEVFASSILCMIGEVVEQSFKVEIEVAGDTALADFATRVSDDGIRWWPLILRVRVHHWLPRAAASNIASASNSPTGTKAAVS